MQFENTVTTPIINREAILKTFSVLPPSFTFPDFRPDLRLVVSPTPKKVIFHEPATIVYWEDGTKTVVKCKKGEKFDKWTGLAMAYMKKTMGIRHENFHSFFKRWCGDEKST